MEIDLMAPRWKMIAPYPDALFEVGNIIEAGDNGVRYVTEITKVSMIDYPHLFKRIKWWEDRGLTELEIVKFAKVIEYVGYWVVGDVVPVTEFIYKQGEPIKYELGKSHPHHVNCIEPATKQDYENWQIKEKSRR